MAQVLVPGAIVNYAGGTYRVHQPLGPDTVLLRNEAGAIISANPAQLAWPDQIPRCGTDHVAADGRYAEADWSEATRRRDILLALSRLTNRTQEDIEGAAKKLGIKRRRVWELLQEGRAHGFDVAGFLPRPSGPRLKRLSPEIEALITQAIEQHYAKDTKRSLASLHEEIDRRCRAATLPPPSYRAVRARVDQCDQIWLTRRREGPKAARALRLLTGAHPGATSPWARVQIDSTLCDIRLVDEADRMVIGRPTVTFALDLYSRALLGFSCLLAGASTLTVATCLAQACRPKDDWLARRELGRLDWPIFGLPETLEYDQGPENLARGIQRGLRLHGIKPKVRPKGHPEQHGHIERVIGTMMRTVHALPGTTFSNINERGENEPDKLACLTLTELERVLAIELDSYNNTTHHATGDRPMDRYLAYYRQPGLPVAERTPPLPHDDLLLDFLPYEHRALRRSGFRLFRVDYSSVDLLPLWRRDNQQPIKRVVVYNPDSLARVWVADEVSGAYIAVAFRVPHPDITLAESLDARKRLHAAKARDRSEKHLFDNLTETRAIVAKARSTTARRKAERTLQANRRLQEQKGTPKPLEDPEEPVRAPRQPDWSGAAVIPFSDVERL